VSNGGDRPGVVLFGMRYVGSPPALRALLGAGYDVRAVVMPGPPGMTSLPPLPGAGIGSGNYIPLTETSAKGNEHVDDVARAAGIPVLLAGSLRRQEVVDAIAAYRPDVITVSCFTLRVPPALLGLPRFGCVNVHPSLLPLNRGLDPVFWTLRRGERETGVTIHLMDEGYDSGPILLQERVAVPDGVRLPDFERQLSELGGRLLVRAIEGLVSGEIVPVPQDDRLATTAPEPTADDYVVRTDRSAVWAYNFVRGVAPLDGPLVLHVVASGERIRLRDAMSYSRDGRQERPVERDGDRVSVQFSPGVARFWTAG
jgi:methionyl-tRNA formyltransferase